MPWSGIEVVITGLTRNQFVGLPARGFESHPLRVKTPWFSRGFVVSICFCTATGFFIGWLTWYILASYLHQRTREGIETARMNGKQIGQVKGSKLTTKKSIAAKELIRKHSRDFGGTLGDVEVIKLAGISRNSYYKYKRELTEEIWGSRTDIIGDDLVYLFQ